MLQINRPDHEQDRVDACVAAMAEAFDRKVSDAMMTAYQLGLVDVPIVNIEHATMEAIRTSKFMPRPVELRQLAGERSPEDRAVAAWQCVCDAAKKYHSYHHVDFDDGLINAAIRNIGGWPNLLSKTEEEFDKWARKDFLASYQSFMRSGAGEDACRPLPGLADTGTHEVRRTDGTIASVNLGGPVKVETGLPLLPGIHHNERTRVCQSTYFLELKKP